jgi:UrcA family protein
MKLRIDSPKTRRVLTRIALVPVLAFAGSCAASANADSADQRVVSQVTVPIQGLDLSQPTDAAVLYQRLRNAARQVCAENGRRDMAARRDARRCEETALENAVRRVDKPRVTAAHRHSRLKRGAGSS